MKEKEASWTSEYFSISLNNIILFKLLSLSCLRYVNKVPKPSAVSRSGKCKLIECVRHVWENFEGSG